MNEEAVISPELESLVNVDFPPETYEIERGMVRKFVEAIEDTNPRWQETAPPTFPAALVHRELIHRLFTAPCALTQFLNGGSELEYFQPIRVGDIISVTGRLNGLRKREGAEGRALFMVVEMTYRNQRGEVVAKGRNTFIRH